MIFETWFILALVGVIVSGIAAFVSKVAAAEKYDIVLLNFLSPISTVILLGCFAWQFSDIDDLFRSAGILAFVLAILFFVLSVLKMRVLEVIDAAIFYPLFKVLAPLLVVGSGIVLFGESFTLLESIGIAVSIFVPLLLISKSENARQSDLKKGLLILLLIAVLSAVGASVRKWGTDVAADILLFTLLLYCGRVVVASVAIFTQRKVQPLRARFAEAKHKGFLKTLLLMTVFQGFGALTFNYALGIGGPLGIVYTINSLYILIPIVLSIMIYGEHWNTRKAFAIGLSLLAVVLLG